MERDSGKSFVQHLAPGLVLGSDQGLKASKDGDCTGSLGNLYQRLPICCYIQCLCLLVSVWACCLQSPSSWKTAGSSFLLNPGRSQTVKCPQAQLLGLLLGQKSWDTLFPGSLTLPCLSQNSPSSKKVNQGTISHFSSPLEMWS